MRMWNTSRPMILIGVTGGLACGKTEVCRVFEKKGATVISGDQIGREVVEKNKKILKELVKSFGQEILNRNQTLNRRKLGEVAFASKESSKLLNKIIHPSLLRELRKRIRILRKKDHGSIVVVDAALIVEWGLQNEFDFLILVASKREDEIRRARLVKGYSLKTAYNMIRCQLPNSSKKKHADLVIDNSGNLMQLKEKSGKAWRMILGSTLLKSLEKRKRKWVDR